MSQYTMNDSSFVLIQAQGLGYNQTLQNERSESFVLYGELLR